MSLQALWSLFVANPGYWTNALALFFALAGAWLLVATRLREQFGAARLAGARDMQAFEGEKVLQDEPTLRLNLFFYRFGYACMALALALSWGSTRV